MPMAAKGHFVVAIFAKKLRQCKRPPGQQNNFVVEAVSIPGRGRYSPALKRNFRSKPPNLSKPQNADKDFFFFLTKIMRRFLLFFVPKSSFNPILNFILSQKVSERLLI